jgi:putative FmdB family regulatory protein
MGVFEYQCSSGHITEKFVPLSERPEQIFCDTCGETARRIVSAVKTTFHANDRKAIKREGR